MTTQESIFEKDPLLLNRQSQRQYQLQLLKNFVSRAASLSDVSRPIEDEQLAPLSDDELRRFCNEYWQAVAERRKLDAGDNAANFIKRLMKSTGVILGERTEGRGDPPDGIRRVRCDSEAEAELAKLGPNVLRIAAIGQRVSITEGQQSPLGELLCMVDCRDLKAEFKLDGYPSTAVMARGRLSYTECGKVLRDEWLDAVETKIKNALSAKAQVVMLPEFGLPMDVAEKAGEVEDRIKKAVCDAEKKEPVFVFSGSRHDGPFNRGLVYQFPSVDASEHEEDLKPWHYKFASARRLGENILGPPGRKLPIYEFEHPGDKNFVVRVGICYDVYDPSIFSALLARQGDRNNERVTHAQTESMPVLLVPSYNPSTKFISLLRDLSFLSQSVVVYVDALHGEGRMFICGVALYDFVENDRYDELVKSINKTSKQLHQTVQEKQVVQLGLERDLVAVEKELEIDKENGGLVKGRAGRIDELSGRIRRDQIELDLVKTQREISQRTKRLAVLMALETDLSQLRDELEPFLDYFVTCHPCEECSSPKPDRGPELHSISCQRDILYFNIPTKLIDALDSFRRTYFANNLQDVIPSVLLPLLPPDKELEFVEIDLLKEDDEVAAGSGEGA